MFQWVEENFDIDVAKKFKEEEINGEALMSERLLCDTTAMEKLGLKTIGKQEKFKKIVGGLKTKGKICYIF